MTKKFLLLFCLITVKLFGMESEVITTESLRAIAPEVPEEMVDITIEDQKRELPKRYIPLSGTLKNLTEDIESGYEEGIPLPITLKIWDYIESQLERLYQMSQDNNIKQNGPLKPRTKTLRDEIFSDYNQRSGQELIDLIKGVEHLDIPILSNILLELAQNKLTDDEILTLPEEPRNKILIVKTLALANLIPQERYEELGFSRRRHPDEQVHFYDNGIVLAGKKIFRLTLDQAEIKRIASGNDYGITSKYDKKDIKLIDFALAKLDGLYTMNRIQAETVRQILSQSTYYTAKIYLYKIFYSLENYT